MNEQIIIENKRKVSATNVKEVKSYNEHEIRLSLTCDGGLCVRGSELKIVSFSKETGSFLMEGKIGFIKFYDKKQDLLKRIFK